MKQQILIETDETGLKLYNSNIKGMGVFASHLDQLNQWTDAIKNLEAMKPELANATELLSMKKLIDLNALLSIAIVDLHIISSALFLSNIKIQNIFYIKHAYLVIYETAQNFKSKQKELRESALTAGPEIIMQHDEAIKSLNEFAKTHQLETTIKDVRHKIAGHIEKDFKIWHQTAVSLNAGDTAATIINFLHVITKLQNLSTALVQFYQRKLSIQNIEIASRSAKKISDLENLIELINLKQPSENKLKIDFSEIKSLLGI